MTSVDDRGDLTLQEAAARLGVHYMTAYRYVRTGQLDAARRDGRWMVRPADLSAFEAGRAGRTPTPAGAPRTSGGTTPAGRGQGAARYRARLLERLLAGDEAGAWGVVESALVANTRPDRAHLDLVAPCLQEIGDRWEAGTLSVGDEHVASATAARVVARLAPLATRRGRTRGTLVLAGSPGERHGLPMTLLANVLRARGWGVVELGPDTPAADVAVAAKSADRLVAVGISVGSEVTEPAARQAVAEVRAAVPAVPVLVGGPAVPDLGTARRLGGDGWGASADDVDTLLATLRTGPRG